MAKVFNFTVGNDDLTARFSCPNHLRRIGQAVKNLCVETDSRESVTCRYTALGDSGGNVRFTFDGQAEEGSDLRREAVFFENTEYPLIVRGNPGVELTEVSLAINNHLRSAADDRRATIISDDGELYGSMNFHNQVGMTDFSFSYKVKGDNQPRTLAFMTEVLSYKLDYRSDLRTIIADIEAEYALLSASLLKDTYLSMRHSDGATNTLIWWQIFRSCYRDITAAARTIIDRPKRRLRSIPRYERAERMATIPRGLENEYTLHRDNPAYLYRTEELMLSHDTIENRFLKHVLTEITSRFVAVREHILTAMHLDDPLRIDTTIEQMESELLRLRNHPFFRGVGAFRGFTQDNLVMKQAVGYKTILEKWIELQQGYELEEGLRKLEVKDVSDLYEIWCFIKVKNIVSDTLRDLGREATAQVDGRAVSRDFIPQLVYGGSMSFINADRIELASVSYNAEVHEKRATSVIDGTGTMTTTQRPDIVLRLSKTSDRGMKYTYLFDAKYRIDDIRDTNGYDMPPEDAINQMHRYRDAIYYTGEGRDHSRLKKEIIAGYVLFPGRIDPSALDLDTGSYYYQQSNRLIGIGAFPLRPDQERHDADGRPYADSDSSEQALRRQIRRWLEDDDDGRDSLLQTAIPQKGLEYTDEPVARGSYYLASIDSHVKNSAAAIVGGTATVFYSGYTSILSGVDFQKIKWFAPVADHKVTGYYTVTGVAAENMSKHLNAEKENLVKAGEKLRYKGYDRPIRIRLTLGQYHSLDRPFEYGLDALAAKGIALTRKEFNEYRRNSVNVYRRLADG